MLANGGGQRSAIAERPLFPRWTSTTRTNSLVPNPDDDVHLSALLERQRICRGSRQERQSHLTSVASSVSFKDNEILNLRPSMDPARVDDRFDHHVLLTGVYYCGNDKTYPPAAVL